MGSVIDIITTGDNDEELYPTRYYQHYVYCDNCGSFAIKHWSATKDAQAYLNYVKLESRLEWALGTSVVAIVLSIFLSFMGLFICLGISVLALIGSGIGLREIKKKTELYGLYCADCQTEYPYGAPFFAAMEENPRNLTMDDVPLPLYEVYQMRGGTVD